MNHVETEAFFSIVTWLSGARRIPSFYKGVPVPVPGAGCRVLGPGCCVPGAGCCVPGAGAGCRVPGAGCRVSGAGCWVSGAECRVPSAGCCVPGAVCWVLGAVCRVPSAGYWVLCAGADCRGSCPTYRRPAQQARTMHTDCLFRHDDSGCSNKQAPLGRRLGGGGDGGGDRWLAAAQIGSTRAAIVEHDKDKLVWVAAIDQIRPGRGRGRRRQGRRGVGSVCLGALSS